MIAMELLSRDDILLINRATIERHGGQFAPPSNLLNASSLDYIVEAVSASVFGTPMYPEIPDKAAFYMHSIIQNHIFQDGNKRTGLASSLVFLNLNGFALREIPSTLNIPEWDEGSPEPVLYEVTMQVAKGHVTLEALRDWFEKNWIPLANK